MNLVSLGFTKGFYYKPRVDKKHLPGNRGLIALSGCIAGEASKCCAGKPKSPAGCRGFTGYFRFGKLYLSSRTTASRNRGQPTGSSIHMEMVSP